MKGILYSLCFGSHPLVVRGDNAVRCMQCSEWIPGIQHSNFTRVELAALNFYKCTMALQVQKCGRILVLSQIYKKLASGIRTDSLGKLSNFWLSSWLEAIRAYSSLAREIWWPETVTVWNLIMPTLMLNLIFGVKTRAANIGSVWERRGPGERRDWTLALPSPPFLLAFPATPTPTLLHTLHLEHDNAVQ